MDSTLVPLWLHVGHPGFPSGAHCYAHGVPMPFPYGFPLVFDWLPMVFPYGGHPLYVHAIPMGSPEGSPWIPMWSHRCFSMRCTCGVSLLPGWFPFPRFSAETVFLVASLVASAPGQCGGAQPGMPCLGTHIASIPPGMVFHLLQQSTGAGVVHANAS